MSSGPSRGPSSSLTAAATGLHGSAVIVDGHRVATGSGAHWGSDSERR